MLQNIYFYYAVKIYFIIKIIPKEDLFMAMIRYGSTAGSKYENVDCGSGTKALSNIKFTGTTGGYVGLTVEDGLKDNQGCVLFCYAMLLRALGASVSNKYDFRTDSIGKISADPYSCLMVNLGIAGDWSTTLKSKQIAYNSNSSPNKINDYDILVSAFGKKYTTKDLSNPTKGTAASIRDNAAALTSALKTYTSGIIVRNGADSHSFIVVSSTYDSAKTYTDDEIADCFRVYDSSGASGTNVTFKDSRTYTDE
jgi:hypothetical protein